jgi:hypothetical protein
LLQIVTGVINNYSPIILQTSGYSGTSGCFPTIRIYGLIMIFTTLNFIVFLVDRLRVAHIAWWYGGRHDRYVLPRMVLCDERQL